MTTAALAVLAAIAVVVTFVAGRYHALGAFYGFTGLSVALLVASVIVGAQGIAEITNNGYQGTWSPKTEDRLFGRQAKLTFGGFLALGVALATGLTAPLQPTPPAKGTATQAAVRQVTQELEAERRRVRAIATRVRELEGRRWWRDDHSR